MNYQIEILTLELQAELLTHQDEYYRQAAAVDAFPPDVWWASYHLLQQTGRLCVLIGRDENKNLKAGSFIVIAPDQHYACITATIGLMYMASDARKGTEGVKFLKTIQKVAELAGAQRIIGHGRVNGRVSKLFEFCKYQHFDNYYIKLLPDNKNGMKPIYKKEGE